ncbi:hypothetical protein [Allokutzneria sp. NRRL B-24872]|uniref:hypothetical protein n=1 Tax=Allokutzneria sp. NRRL B-24872 TaxID=1137961 RepID=UPI000A3AD5BC|nr:hypothetical protein [Allokutzneria sp. NRRL B-24872]
MSALTRVLGAATAAYGIATAVRPQVLAKPCGLTTPSGDVTASVRTLITAIGMRDTAIGAAMLFAPPGRAQRVAVLTRVASDAADALVFGLTLPDRRARGKAAGVAAGWAALCALSALRG